MKSFYLILSAVSISIFFSCSNRNSKNLDTWLGDYHYSEQPVKAIAGYEMVMEWGLSVMKNNDRYIAMLNVQGQQTSFSLLYDIKGNANRIIILYNDLIDGIGPGLAKGDTLFILSKNNTKIITIWAQLEPRLSEKFPKECSCFNFIGVNANKNIQQLP